MRYSVIAVGLLAAAPVWAATKMADQVFKGQSPTASGQVACSTAADSASWQTPASCGISGGGSSTYLNPEVVDAGQVQAGTLTVTGSACNAGACLPAAPTLSGELFSVTCGNGSITLTGMTDGGFSQTLAGTGPSYIPAVYGYGCWGGPLAVNSSLRNVWAGAGNVTPTSGSCWSVEVTWAMSAIVSSSVTTHRLVDYFDGTTRSDVGIYPTTAGQVSVDRWSGSVTSTNTYPSGESSNILRSGANEFIFEVAPDGGAPAWLNGQPAGNIGSGATVFTKQAGSQWRLPGQHGMVVQRFAFYNSCTWTDAAAAASWASVAGIR